VLTATAAATVITCNTTSTVTLTIAGGTAPYMNAGPFTESSTGLKSYTVTDDKGCTATATVTVMSNLAPPTLTITGGSVLNCVWSNGSVLAASNPITAAGAYSVVATGANGCSATATKTVTSNTNPPIIGISGATSFCSGASSVLSTSPGFAIYNWSNGGMTRQITITTPGTYTVTVTAANGCATTKSVLITLNTLPTLTLAATTPVCLGSDITIVATVGGSPAPSSVNWYAGSGFTANTAVSGGSTTLTRTSTVASTNTYVARAQNVCGTRSVGTSVQTRGMIPVTVAIQNASTLGGATGSAVVTAPASTTFLWSSGETVNNIRNKAPGTYIVTVTPPPGSPYCGVVRSIVIN
jgi:hypothetical protein